MQGRRRISSALLAVVTTVAGLVAAAPQAHADGTLINDIDCDGTVDYAVGVPGYNSSSGAVEVLLSGNGTPHRQVFTPNDIGGSTGVNGQFGSVIEVSDLDQDGCSDLIVGQPFPRVSDTDPAEAGRVSIVYGSGTGLDFSRNRIVSLGEPDDWFGGSIAVLGAPVPTALVVGAPFYWGNDTYYGGGIAVYPLVGGEVDEAGVKILTQNSPGVPSSSRTADAFGWAVAASGNTVLVGTPNEDISGKSNAGQATLLTFDSTLAISYAKAINQDTSGVPDGTSTSDLFGASVAASANWFAIGAPGENLGTVVNAGLVQPFTYTPGGSISPKSAIHQNSTGVPGSNEKNDYFGDSITFFRPAAGARALAIGAPRENIGTAADAGQVTLVRVSGTGFTNRALEQGTSSTPAEVSGVRSANELLGYSVRAIVDDPASGAIDRLAIGTPLDEGALGSLSILQSPFTSTQEQYLGDLDAGGGFGAVVARTVEKSKR